MSCQIQLRKTRCLLHKKINDFFVLQKWWQWVKDTTGNVADKTIDNSAKSK